jgi:hypothetical protein
MRRIECLDAACRKNFEKELSTVSTLALLGAASRKQPNRGECPAIAEPGEEGALVQRLRWPLPVSAIPEAESPLSLQP